jgi:hypothetical protein
MGKAGRENEVDKEGASATDWGSGLHERVAKSWETHHFVLKRLATVQVKRLTHGVGPRTCITPTFAGDLPRDGTGVICIWFAEHA